MCRTLCENRDGNMATNLAIDNDLLEQAKKVGGHRTKKAAVIEALEEYIQAHKQKKLIELFGTVNYDERYDYKAQRKKS